MEMFGIICKGVNMVVGCLYCRGEVEVVFGVVFVVRGG